MKLDIFFILAIFLLSASALCRNLFHFNATLPSFPTETTFDIIPKKTDNQFHDVFVHLLKYEGGYVNDASDHGGETKYGISKAAHPEIDILNLSYNDAYNIYYKAYWLKSKINQVDDRKVALKLMDIMVQFGDTRGRSIWVNALTKMNINSKTLGLDDMVILTNQQDEQQLLSALHNAQISAYMRIVKGNPASKKYLKGWINRANASI